MSFCGSKDAVVLGGLRGETRIADIHRKYGIAESISGRIKGDRRALEQASGMSKAGKLKNEIKELQRIIGGENQPSQ